MMKRPIQETRLPVAHSADTRRVVIVADDLTGACDSGVAFLASGRTVRVMLEIAGFHRDSSQADADVLAFTTETRGLPQENAKEQVVRTMSIVGNISTDPIFFKKVDSAARGHLGVETMAALDASGALLALLAPAFPQAGRRVRAGLLSIRDAADQDRTVSLRDLFPNVDDPHIDILPSGTETALAQGIAQASVRGIRVLICDSETQADLERLATAAYRTGLPLLWTGSAGLAKALARSLPASSRIGSVEVTPRRGRTLLIIGTDHPVTSLQLSHIEEQTNAQRLNKPDHAIHRVQWDSPSHHEIRTAFAAAPVAALVLSGGDTAAFVLRALDASSILLAGELAPGIPWGIIEGGDANGCVVVTKSGGFGTRDALVNIIDFCKRRTCASA